MSIYEKYEKMGLIDYKLRTIDDVKELHGIDVLAMKGYNYLSKEDRDLVIRLFIGYLNGCGCNNRQDTPVDVEKLRDDKFKIYLSSGKFIYLYSDGSIG